MNKEPIIKQKKILTCQKCHAPLPQSSQEYGEKALEFYAKWNGKEYLIVCRHCLEKN